MQILNTLDGNPFLERGEAIVDGNAGSRIRQEQLLKVMVGHHELGVKLHVELAVDHLNLAHIQVYQDDLLVRLIVASQSVDAEHGGQDRSLDLEVNEMDWIPDGGQFVVKEHDSVGLFVVHHDFGWDGGVHFGDKAQRRVGVIIEQFTIRIIQVKPVVFPAVDMLLNICGDMVVGLGYKRSPLRQGVKGDYKGKEYAEDTMRHRGLELESDGGDDAVVGAAYPGRIYIVGVVEPGVVFGQT